MITHVDGGTAFPCQHHGSTRSDAFGMSLRDYFMAHAPIEVSDANEFFYRSQGRNASLSEMLETLATLRRAYASQMLAERLK